MSKPKKPTTRSATQTKVKHRGRQVPIIDEYDHMKNPVPLSRYAYLETKASRTGPFKRTP